MSVLLFGTFDILHPGHQNLFKQARRWGKRIIAVVARDRTVRAVKNLPPKFPEKKRLMNLRQSGMADKAILGSGGDKYKIIKKIKPAVICLGYDQRHFVSGLKKKIKEYKLNTKIVRLKSYRPGKYKSSILKTVAAGRRRADLKKFYA